MGMTWQSDPLVAGAAEGRVMRLDAPVSFWGGVSPTTSQITLAGHPQFGQTIAGTMLVVPRMVGSSSSSAVLLELIHKGRAPAALILGTGDAILPIAAIVARQMGWPAPPVVVLQDPPFQSGQPVGLGQDGSIWAR